MTTKRMTIGAVLAALTLSVSARAAEVDRRERRQQQRIAEGIESGKLTPGEAAKLERKEARIRREIRRDRAENGGKLTKAERRKINRQQNKVSREIYEEKHDQK